jgi:exodeoxyribonuclease V alpha subunit
VTGPAAAPGRVDNSAPDPHDPRIAARASGLLASANRAGVLVAADVHVAARLGALAGEQDARVLLAAALAVRAVREGSVCVDLPGAAISDIVTADDSAAPSIAWPEPAGWLGACERSPLVAVGPQARPRPLRLVGGLLYLDRYWEDERVVARELERRLNDDAGRTGTAGLSPSAVAVLDVAFGHPRAGSQRAAAERAVRAGFTVVTGGPGTGKTHTVAGILAALLQSPGPRPRIGLAAPTGKAAARLGAAVRESAREDWARPAADVLAGLQAQTLHRLLGPRPGSRTRFRHDRVTRLPHDVVVVDETSMVSLSLMARLLEAVRPDARLVLVGDPDQLSSVEAGAVLRDVVDLGERYPADPADRDAGAVRRLTHNFRAGSAALNDIADRIRTGDADGTLEVLRSGPAAVEFVEADVAQRTAGGVLRTVRDDVVRYGSAVAEAAGRGDGDEAIRAAAAHRVLCGHRAGPYGVSWWSARVERWLFDAGVIPAGAGWPRPDWPIGTPVIVTANEYDTRLVNGDSGVVVAHPAAGVVAVLDSPTAPRLHPARIPSLRPAHALTVHKSQGTEFDAVTVVLPPPASPLLVRELLYTAVTRARSRIRVIGTEAALREAVGRPIRRATGLSIATPVAPTGG